MRGRIGLRAAGREIANRVLNRHHLIERMLTEIFGMEWYKVHDEAEQLEHAVSADFERKLADKLGARRSLSARKPRRMDSPDERRRLGNEDARGGARGRTPQRWPASSSATAACWSCWTG